MKLLFFKQMFINKSILKKEYEILKVSGFRKEYCLQDTRYCR